MALSVAPMPDSEVIGVIVGAVVLFSMISFLPIYLTWRQRRRIRQQREQERQQRQNNHVNRIPVPMAQVVAERQYYQQSPPNPTEQYNKHDSCPICLSALDFRSSQESVIPAPEPVRIAASPPPFYVYPQNYDHYLNDNSRVHVTDPTGQEEGQRDSQDSQPSTPSNEVWVLHGCSHAFHAPCLASWFRYGRYICPICKTPYYPVIPP